MDVVASDASAVDADPVLSAMRERGLLAQYERLFEDALAGGAAPPLARELPPGFAHVTEAALAAQAAAPGGGADAAAAAASGPLAQWLRALPLEANSGDVYAAGMAAPLS